MASITGLNDDIISSAALKAFVDSLHPLSAFSVNYNAEAARKGEVVSIPLISSITASTFNNTYEGADGDVTLTAREVTIDKHFVSTVDTYHTVRFATLKSAQSRAGQLPRRSSPRFGE